MRNARYKRVIVFLLNGFAGRQRKGAHGAPMKGTKEGNVQLSFGMPARQLKCGFDCLGARVAEIDSLGSPPGGQGSKLFGQKNLGRVVKIGSRHMQQPFGLLLDGPDNLGMTVAGGIGCDAGSKIKKDVAVDIMYPETISLLSDQRVYTGV